MKYDKNDSSEMHIIMNSSKDKDDLQDLQEKNKVLEIQKLMAFIRMKVESKFNSLTKAFLHFD